MQFKPCGCSVGGYERVARSWWMRLLPSRRLYRCDSCAAVMFIRKDPLFHDTVVMS